jgi:hypothetical protein
MPAKMFVIGSTAYYEDWNPPGGTLGGLMAVPTSGGAPRVFMSPSPLPTVPPGSSDGTSYYFTPIRAVGDVGGLSMLTPPSTTVVALTTERFLAVSTKSYGDDAYFIGYDFALTNGFIGRVPKRGGAAQHLVSDIGFPVRTLVVDDTGLYWGAPHAVLHAGLDGSSVQQILAEGPNSIAATHGRLYFTTATEVASVAAAGGPVATVAGNQNAPTMLTIAGSNLVWMNGFQGPPDGGAVGSPGVDGLCGVRRFHGGDSRRIHFCRGIRDSRRGWRRSSANAHRDGVQSEVSRRPPVRRVRHGGRFPRKERWARSSERTLDRPR